MYLRSIQYVYKTIHDSIITEDWELKCLSSLILNWLSIESYLCRVEYCMVMSHSVLTWNHI